MYICGQHFFKSVIDQIQEALQAEPEISRRELSRRVCEWLGWRSASGQLQDMSCRKALGELHRRGVLDLPVLPERTYGFERSAAAAIEVDAVEVECSLSELDEVSVRPIDSRDRQESRIWFALMDRYHYLGSGPLCGAQIRYFIESSIYGYIGALAFSSASWALRCRDEHIGWTEEARRANLHLVVSNSRFLILPSVRVDNLASQVLSLALSRLPDDWQQRYHARPVMVETFVDPSRFAGTCYKASNWIDIGQTAGRRQDGRPKKILVYHLCPQWKEILCAQPQIQLGVRPRTDEPAHWAEEEFGTIRLYDDRLKQRLYTVAQDFYHCPQGNIPEACGGERSRAVGAYRLFQNKRVTMDVILDAHTEATIERIKHYPVVLAPQDTTTLDYTTHPMTKDLGPVSRVNSQSIGLLLHDTLAFTEDGTPLGILDAQCWARDPDDRGKKYRRDQLPIEQKESMKWLRSFRKVAQIQKLCPGTMLISIGDRESDIYELFLEASKDPQGPRLLVRAEKTRNRHVEQEQLIEQQHLWDFMASQSVAGSVQIHIPHSGSNQKARDAWLDVRFAPVTLPPPTRYPSYPPVQAWAVYATERDAPDEITEPIEWMLLTTVPVTSFADAQKQLERYSGRWGIEVYHRTLKSGCRIEDRQLGSADRIETCLGIDMVVAWRIYHLTMLGRETPDVPCTVFFKDIEWKALCCYAHKTPNPPQQPPSLYEAICLVAAVGGFLGKKTNNPPGTQTLWRGLQKLDTATEMYAILNHQDYSHPLQSGP